MVVAVPAIVCAVLLLTTVVEPPRAGFENTNPEVEPTPTKEKDKDLAVSQQEAVPSSVSSPYEFRKGKQADHGPTLSFTSNHTHWP